MTTLERIDALCDEMDDDTTISEIAALLEAIYRMTNDRIWVSRKQRCFIWRGIGRNGHKIGCAATVGGSIPAVKYVAAASKSIAGKCL